ncbi:hypothetical protein ACFFUB_12945 [Algimonas porphyrae]|uniref:Haloacid dehalogenase-like hydrolase n=1 Tax=Algimonas porphyrae TaxID=1128113 RepID=A0ABQ5UVY6_9PROT|nr:hypothetical protein [Algimonas porphyrae]GLQ19321.1 hypothetical protein GCM10007854_02760 [Algimonas porphyrae]
MSARPLILDVDGTLIKSDLTHEMILEAIKRDPHRAVQYGWLGLRSKPQMKQRMVARIGERLAVDALPLEPRIVDLARQAVAKGRDVYLCSGTEQSLVSRLGETLDFVTDSFGTSPTYNMTSENKAAFLEDRFPDGFDYAGNSTQDFAVWEAAQSAYAIRPPAAAEITTTAALQPVNILEERPSLPGKLPLLLKGLEIWKLIVLLVPLLLITALLGQPSDVMLTLTASTTLLFLAHNVGRMLRGVQRDRRRGGSFRTSNAIATGDLSVPLALLAYTVLGLAGLGVLAMTSPRLSALVLAVALLWAVSQRITRRD